MSHPAHIRSIRELLQQFFEQRTRDLNRRARRNYEEVLELVDEFLAELGIDSVDMRTQPDGPMPATVAPVVRVLDLLEDFEDRYLIAQIGAEREFVRVAEFVVRDLMRWLRGRRITRTTGSLAATA